MTRARAKLLEQQVNSLLAQPDICLDENFILPKSLHLCMIRFEEFVARNEAEQRDMELDMKNTQECAREEREAGATQLDEEIHRAENSPISLPRQDFCCPGVAGTTGKDATGNTGSAGTTGRKGAGTTGSARTGLRA